MMVIFNNKIYSICLIIYILLAFVRFQELEVGGTLWFQNLTDIDPTLCLPLTLCLSNLLIIEVSHSNEILTIFMHKINF